MDTSPVKEVTVPEWYETNPKIEETIEAIDQALRES